MATTRVAHLWRIAATLCLSGALAACPTPEEEDTGETIDLGAEPEVGAPIQQSFVAQLRPVNADLTESAPAGEARLTVEEDSLVIMVMATGLPPGMMHLQHFHGKEDGSAARCPGPEADANGDGIIDVVETEAAAGTTMVPFHEDPVSMEIVAETYPTADAEGTYTYRQTVPLEALRSAFAERFGTPDLALDQRVVFIHGVPEEAQLPNGVQSVLGAPAHVTVPIACGELRESSGM